jgi:CheY-like chemotaxis protein
VLDCETLETHTLHLVRPSSACHQTTDSKAGGFEVFSAIGFAEALELCSARHDFDLILMGHSMPRKDKTALLAALRPNCKASLLSIRRHDDPPLPESDYSVDSFDGPHALLEMVTTVLA